MRNFLSLARSSKSYLRLTESNFNEKKKKAGDQGVSPIDTLTERTGES